MPEKPRIGSLFSGYGGLDMGVAAHYGGRVVWHVENDKHARTVLAATHPEVPVLGDVSAVDWSQVEPVEIVAGGVPCQSVSVAGMRAGLTSTTRTGLWFEMLRAVEALRPQVVVFENVQGIRSAKGARSAEEEAAADGPGRAGCADCDVDAAAPVRALGIVLADLAGLGYVGRWGSVRAADADAPHRRERVFVVARPAGGRWG